MAFHAACRARARSVPPLFVCCNSRHVYSVVLYSLSIWVAGKPRFPTHFAKELRDLLKNLLQPDITKRYGMLKNGVSDIKDSSFFKGMDWIALYHREVATEHTPAIKGPDDASHYEVYQEVRAECCMLDRAVWPSGLPLCCDALW